MSTSRRGSRTLVRRGAVAVVVVGCAGGLLLGAGASPRATALGAVDLAGARPYAVLAGGTVTGSGTSSITGDVGGSTVGGLDGAATGTVRTGGATAQALADLGGADGAVAARPVTAVLRRVSGTLGPGTYGVSGAIDVQGVLTLDAGGDADATFVLKTDSRFTTGGGTAVTLAGGARACNVFWLAGGSATVDGTVVGTVFARSGITVRSGATVTGRLLSRSGAVRLEGATVRVPTDCDGATPVTGPPRPADGGYDGNTRPPGGAEIVAARGAEPPGDAGTAGAGRGAARAGRSPDRSPNRSPDRRAAGGGAGGGTGGQVTGAAPARPGAGRTREPGRTEPPGRTAGSGAGSSSRSPARVPPMSGASPASRATTTTARAAARAAAGRPGPGTPAARPAPAGGVPAATDPGTGTGPPPRPAAPTERTRRWPSWTYPTPRSLGPDPPPVTHRNGSCRFRGLPGERLPG